MKLYEQIRQRTGGYIYLGVTGPVRVGKSTFVKRMMEELVIPNIADEFRRERARDELPQSGSGKTIMTAEPKFVPEEAVEISPDGKTALSVRLIDSVGYMIPGALGATEDGAPRMVTTPWFDHEIPLTEAAELGTKKVMDSHCTAGIVITTDGTVTEIDREDYVQAERRAIMDMQATGKPFLVLVNSTAPQSEAAENLSEQIRQEYGVCCRAVDLLTLSSTEIASLLSDLLGEFSVEQMEFIFPSWFDALEPKNELKRAVYAAILRGAGSVPKLSCAEALGNEMTQLDQVSDCSVVHADPGCGSVRYELKMPQSVFYEILSERSGVRMENDADLLCALTKYNEVRIGYDRLQSALEQVRTTGYGIVMPSREEVELQKPELVKKGGAYGVRLRANAPSIHMMRADISAELSPMVGDERQSQELVGDLVNAYDAADRSLWDSNLFGKTLYDLVNESLSAKITGIPEESRMKIRRALTKIVNEGANGLICLVL